MVKSSVRLTILLILAAACLPVMADEGRTPIYLDPTVITTSGKYIVTRDIVGASGLPIIDIQASDVDIDLNGFMLLGGPGPAVITAQMRDNITIRNGTIKAGQNGIEILGAGHRKVVIEDVKVIASEFYGIRIHAISDITIRRVNVIGTGADAIEIDSTGILPVQGTIEHCQVEVCGGGITVRGGASFAIVHNRVEDVTVGPIVCPGGIVYDVSSGGLIAQNTVQDVKIGTGICLGDTSGTKIYNNVVRRAQFDGIWIGGFSDDNLILENVVTLSGVDGISVDGSRNFVDRNLLNSNGTTGTGHGLHFHFALGGGNNTYGRNTARGSFGGPCLPPPGPFNTPDFCDDSAGANHSYGDNYIPGPPLQ